MNLFNTRSSPFGQYIQKNHPELDEKLGPMRLDEVRVFLNEFLGVDVKGEDRIDDGLNVCLKAIMERDANEPNK